MGWAARAKVGAQKREQRERTRALRATRTRLLMLRSKIRRGVALSADDHRILAMAGPETLTWLGYQPSVTLQ